MDVSSLSNLARLSTLSQLSGLSGIGGVIQTPDVQSVATLGQLQTSFVVQLSDLSRIEGAFSALQTAASGLTAATLGSVFAAGSFNAAVATATAGNGAVPGFYSVQVSQLAQPQTLATSGLASDTAPIGSGIPTTLTFQFGTVGNEGFTPNPDQPAQTVTINANSNSLQGIAAAINNANFGVKAGVVNTGGVFSLQLTSANTGASNAFTVNVAGDTALQNLLTFAPGGTEAMTETTVAQNALFSVNGVAMENQTNTVENAIPGVTLNLEGVGAANINVVSNIGQAVDRVTSFVNDFNTLQTFLNAFAGTGGALQNDFLVETLQTQLPSLVLNTTAGGLTLAQIGITVNPDHTLALDSVALASALQANPAAVAQVFSNNGAGIADQVGSLAQLVAGPGGALTSDVAAITQDAVVAAQQQQLTGLFALESQLLTDQLLGANTFSNALQSNDLFLAAQLGLLGNLTGTGGDGDQDDAGLWGGILGDIATQSTLMTQFSPTQSTTPQE